MVARDQRILVRAGKLARDQVDAILRDSEAKTRALGIPIDRGDFQAFGRAYAVLPRCSSRLCPR